MATLLRGGVVCDVGADVSKTSVVAVAGEMCCGNVGLSEGSVDGSEMFWAW